MNWQEKHLKPQIENPKPFLAQALQASEGLPGEFTRMYNSISSTQAEARFAINQLWAASEQGESGLGERLKDVVKRSQGDFNADPGLLEIMAETLDDHSLYNLAVTLKASAKTIVTSR